MATINIPITKKYKERIDNCVTDILAGEQEMVNVLDDTLFDKDEDKKGILYIVSVLEKYPDNDACSFLLLKYSLTKDNNCNTESLIKHYDGKNHYVCCEIGVMYDTRMEHKDAFKYFEKAFLMGNIRARTFLASYYTHPRTSGCTLNPDNAIALLESCIDENYNIAYYFLASLYDDDTYEGYEKYHNQEKANEYYKQCYVQCEYFPFGKETKPPQDYIMGKIHSSESFLGYDNMWHLERDYKNRRNSYIMHKNLNKNISQLSERISSLETELYAPGNMGSIATKQHFADMVVEQPVKLQSHFDCGIQTLDDIA